MNMFYMYIFLFEKPGHSWASCLFYSFDQQLACAQGAHAQRFPGL